MTVDTSRFYKEEITKLATGATMLNLSNKALGSLKISLPAPEVQQVLLNQINEVTLDQYKLDTVYQQKLDALAELKQSILQKAFSGELTQQKAAA